MCTAAREQAEAACSTMQAALAAFKDSKDASCPAPSRQQVAAAVQLVRMEVAKLGLVYSQSGTADTAADGTASGTAGSSAAEPRDADAEALLKGMQGAVCTLCMLCTGIAAAPGAGPTLRASLAQTATAVVEACVALVRGAVLNGAHGPQLMMLSGFALQMLEEAERAPLDSRTAIGRAITQVLKQIADALRELAEAVQQAEEELAEAGAAAAGSEGAGSGSSAQANGSGGAGEQRQAGAAAGGEEADAEADADADSDAGFGMFVQDPFTAAQLAVARLSHSLLAATLALGKAVVKLLLAEREGLTPEAAEGWESMLYHIKALAPVADDLAASSYPPQDLSELSSASEALVNGCLLLCEECPPPSSAAAASAPADASQEQQAGPEQVVASSLLQAELKSVKQAHAELAKEAESAGGDAGGEAAAAGDG